MELPPHLGIAALLQKASHEKEETEKTKKWMREKNHARLAAASGDSELKSAQAAYWRQVAEEDKEKDSEEAWKRSEREKERKREIERREERTAKQLDRIKYEEDKENRTKRKILANSLELRELERALRESYTKKEQKAQVAERKLREAEEERRREEWAAKIKVDNETAVKAEKRQAEERYLTRLKYQEDLEKQLDEAELKKEEAYEEFLREKALIDEIARRIQEEDERETRRKWERKAELAKYIVQFQEERESWKKTRALKILEENRRIEKYAKEREEREREARESRRTARVEEEKVAEKLAEKLKEKEDEKTERREMALELAEAKREEETKELERKEFESRIRRRLQMQKDASDEAGRRVERKATEKREEEEFRRIMLKKMAEDEKLEQLNAQRRRLKEMEHRRAVERLIDDRRRSAVSVREEERRAFEDEMEEERQRRLIVEEERQRILETHAQRLLGFIPRGILKPTDLAKLKPEIRVKFQSAPEEDDEESEDWTIPGRRLVGGRFQ